MGRGPVVLLGQGELYDDPADWRELMRARRIRRGVELAVRRDGVTTWLRPEEAPELAAVLDEVDPPGLPSTAPPVGARASAAGPARPAGVPSAADLAQGGATAVPPSALPRGPAPTLTGPPRTGPPRTGPPRVRKRWPFGLWRWVIGAGLLLLLRLCATDGFGPWPAFGDRSRAAAGAAPAAACSRVHGWIARATCGDTALQRLRPELARAYAARAQALGPAARSALAAAQTRWQEARSACRLESDPGACLEDRYRARLAELRRGGG